MPREIIIVEDEIIIVRELENILHNLGHHVCAFTATAAGALQKVKKYRPDLVLMDIQLRGEKDGIQAAQKIKELYDIPLVYVTAFADQELLERAKVTEPYGYVLKPFDARELQVAIEIALYKQQAEKEKAELTAQLEEARKMNAIATFAGGTAHECNNILWAIMGYTELSLDDTIPGSRLHQNLQVVVKSIQRAKDLLCQFLAFSNAPDFDQTAIPLESFIEDSLTALAASLPPNLKIQKKLQASGSLITVNPDRFRQMLSHLYDNAIQAMEAKEGTLTVTLEDLSLKAAQPTPVQTSPPGSYCQLTIADNGKGMDQTVMDHMFEPFFTTKGLAESKGLGLSMVYGIVRGLGGIIQASSQVGKGSTFRILLPRADKESISTD